MNQEKREFLGKEFDQVRVHPFEFGFRQGVLDKRFALKLVNNEWHFIFNQPDVDLDCWDGNCVDDVVLTTKKLAQTYGNTRSMKIGRYFSANFLDTGHYLDHYRVFITTDVIGEEIEIDHSRFFTSYLGESTLNRLPWKMLSNQEVIALQQDTKVRTGSMKHGLSYCEFEYLGEWGLAYLYIKPEDENSYTLGIQLVMPNATTTPKILNIPYTINYGVPGKQLSDFVKSDERFTGESHGQHDGYDLPAELRLLAQKWFLEIASLIP